MFRLAARLALLSIVGCATPVAEDISSDDSELATLRARTAVAGIVRAGSTNVVRYSGDPASYAPTTAGVPYLAFEIVDERAAQVSRSGLRPQNGETSVNQTVEVEGKFPGKPAVVVVDEAFKVLASATARTRADGTDLAVVDAPRQPGKRFVLVRDGLWTKPMDFQIRIDR